MAAALAEAGVQVAISGHTLASLEAAAETLASRTGKRPTVVVGDGAAKHGPANRFEGGLGTDGRIDILVNNAGEARPITGEVDDAYLSALISSYPNFIQYSAHLDVAFRHFRALTSEAVVPRAATAPQAYAVKNASDCALADGGCHVRILPNFLRFLSEMSTLEIV